MLGFIMVLYRFSGGSKWNSGKKRVKSKSILTKVVKNIQKAVAFLEIYETSVMRLFSEKS